MQTQCLNSNWKCTHQQSFARLTRNDNFCHQYILAFELRFYCIRCTLNKLMFMLNQHTVWNIPLFIEFLKHRKLKKIVSLWQTQWSKIYWSWQAQHTVYIRAVLTFFTLFSFKFLLCGQFHYQPLKLKSWASTYISDWVGWIDFILMKDCFLKMSVSACIYIFLSAFIPIRKKNILLICC